MGKLKNSLRNIIEIIKSKDKEKIKALIIDLLKIILIICIIKLPIILVRDILFNYIQALNVYNPTMNNTYYLIFDIIYYIIIIIYTIKTIIKKYN